MKRRIAALLCACMALSVSAIAEAPVVAVPDEADLQGEYGAANEAAGYKVTFSYADTTGKEIERVSVCGNMNFFTPEDEAAYAEAGYPKESELVPATAYMYREGMFTAQNNAPGVPLDGLRYEMEEQDGVYTVSMPLPAEQYSYKFAVQYAGEDAETLIADPDNPSEVQSSLLLVGSAEDAPAMLNAIFPAQAQGTIEYASVTASSGIEQRLEIYLPADYDASRTYKTIYASHGSGGDEKDWFTIGSLRNILDNLYERGELHDTIVVTMDNNHPFENMKDLKEVAHNLAEVVVPFIEASYPVSTNPQDRALFGLSAGGSLTETMLQTIPEAFSVYGISSVGRSFPMADAEADPEAIAAVTVRYYSGSLDFRTPNTELLAQEANGAYTVYSGAHDWTMWSAFATDFIVSLGW